MTADELLEVLRADPASTALFTDFDGTLAPIVADPASARPFPGAVEALAAIARRYRRVAVLSGRPLDYLDPLVPPVIDVAALYGLEERVGGRRGEHADAARWRPIMVRLAADATQALAQERGVTVEPKGLSLTVHYRNAADPAGAAAAVQRWAEAAGAAVGLHPRAAKASVELHPSVDIDKGSLLTRWAQGATTIAFFGDDVGDIPAYTAIHTLAQRAGTTAVGVLAAGEETPEELVGLADVVLDGPAAIAALFTALAQP